MTPARRDLILADLWPDAEVKQWAMSRYERYVILMMLRLFPKRGKMPRWSSQNQRLAIRSDQEAFRNMQKKGWLTIVQRGVISDTYAVTRAGAEAAGVLGRCRKEDLR